MIIRLDSQGGALALRRPWWIAWQPGGDWLEAARASLRLMLWRRQENDAPPIAPAAGDGADDDLAAGGVAGMPDPPTAPTRPDEQLIRAAQRGDLDAFNLLVLRYERGVFNVCLRLLRDVAGAEDVTQDTFVKAWTSIGTFRGEAFRPWLFRIATNRCYDLLRVRGRRPAASLDAEPFEVEPTWSTQGAGDEPPEAYSLRRELSIHLERALAALPEDQRTVVLLADVQGYDYSEVAAATGAALGTVKSRLSRARARLRQIIHDDDEAGELFDRYSRHYEDRDGS